MRTATSLPQRPRILLYHSPAGINRSRVEDMEIRLKQDILAEALMFGNQVGGTRRGDKGGDSPASGMLGTLFGNQARRVLKGAR